MQVLEFVGRKVHGYLRFDIKFLPGLTFLVGVNGSGKTSVVRSIHALLAPQLRVLMNTSHKKMQVVVKEAGETITVTSANFKEQLTLRVSGVDEVLTVPRFRPAPEFQASRYSEQEESYYNSLESSVQSHPVVMALRKLPTPMFLGLNRRANTRTVSVPARLVRHLVDGQSQLGRSLSDINEMAIENYSEAGQAELAQTNQLRHRLITKAFHFSEGGQADRFPTAEERRRMAEQREMVSSAVKNLGEDGDSLARQVNAYFDRLEGLLKNLPENGTLEGVFSKNNPGAVAIGAAMDWLINHGQFAHIKQIAEDVESFVAKRRAAWAQIDAYRAVVNQFLNDTGKEIVVGPRGLSVRTPDGTMRAVSALSSGEQQIVVLLTHLAFNRDAKRAGILIIDEPELSLHVTWQEKFADAVLEANPRLQVILATHSPSIILDKVDNCVELLG